MKAWRGVRQVCLMCVGVALASVYACSSSTRDFNAPGTGGAEDGAGAKPEAPSAGTNNGGGGEPSELGDAGQGGQSSVPGAGGVQNGGVQNGGVQNGGGGGEDCGACGSECVSGEKSCDPLGFGLRTCDASGQWGKPVPCTGLACPVGATSCQGTATCPKAKPSPGTDCGSLGLLCSYGGSGCGCLAENSGAKWSCSSTFTCVGNCFNQTCAGTNDMCTTEGGRCTPVTCNADADCCGLTACDNLTDRCSKGKSPYFMCVDGQCTRATTDYDGACKALEPVIDIQSTCEKPCPATQPSNGKRCMPYQQSCTYGAKSCVCSLTGANIGWQCTG